MDIYNIEKHSAGEFLIYTSGSSVPLRLFPQDFLKVIKSPAGESIVNYIDKEYGSLDGFLLLNELEEIPEGTF